MSIKTRWSIYLLGTRDTIAAIVLPIELWSNCRGSNPIGLSSVLAALSKPKRKTRYSITEKIFIEVRKWFGRSKDEKVKVRERMIIEWVRVLLYLGVVLLRWLVIYLDASSWPSIIGPGMFRILACCYFDDWSWTGCSVTSYHWFTKVGPHRS